MYTSICTQSKIKKLDFHQAQRYIKGAWLINSLDKNKSKIILVLTRTKENNICCLKNK